MTHRLTIIGTVLAAVTTIILVKILPLFNPAAEPFRDPRTIADTKAPFKLTDSVLEQPVIVCRLDLQSGSFHGYTVAESVGAESFRREICEALTWQQNYRKSGALCFDPGMAIRFGPDSAPTDILICLECSWMYIYREDQLKEKVALTLQGVTEFTEIYSSLFPEQEPVENNHLSATKSGSASEF